MAVKKLLVSSKLRFCKNNKLKYRLKISSNWENFRTVAVEKNMRKILLFQL